MAFFDETTAERTSNEGRVEGIAKVTGKGKYAAEYDLPQMCYAVLVDSPIPAGRILSIQTEIARQVDGVIDVISYFNKQPVPGLATAEKIKASKFGLPIFHTDAIYFKGQPVAMVIANTLEDATYAASLVEVKYQASAYEVDFHQKHPHVPLATAGKENGKVENWDLTTTFVEEEYTIEMEVHHPMEMHATIAHWTGNDRLRLFDKNQGVLTVQKTISALYDLPPQNVEVTSAFVGGGFGSGLKVWPHVLAATMAAKQVKRPVKLMLTRPQMFYSVGYRPSSWQKIKLGVDQNLKFTGLIHQAKNNCAMYDPFNDRITRVSRLIYHFGHLKTEEAVVPLHLAAPTWKRGPGDATGDFAIECAIDELSYKLNIDPIALRQKNLALDKNPDNGLPWSSHFIAEALSMGAEKIGWHHRKPQPQSLLSGDWQIGYGMAVGMWHAGRQQASANLTLTPQGDLILRTAMTDIGTGTGTAMVNVMHELTGFPKHRIKVELGHSDLPPARNQGGSTGLASIVGAVHLLGEDFKKALFDYAQKINPSLQAKDAETIQIDDQHVVIGQTSILLPTLFEKNQLEKIEMEATAGPGNEREKWAFAVSAAHFCKLKVHRFTGKVVIDQMVAVVDGGRIINPKAAENQIIGAAFGGIGMALLEEQQVDAQLGTLVGCDLAGYHFAVNADGPKIDVAFIDQPDPHINQNGAKGIGEVGIIGTAPAIANAIYNATGKRIRSLPITADKILKA